MSRLCLVPPLFLPARVLTLPPLPVTPLLQRYHSYFHLHTVRWTDNAWWSLHFWALRSALCKLNENIISFLRILSRASVCVHIPTPPLKSACCLHDSVGMPTLHPPTSTRVRSSNISPSTSHILAPTWHAFFYRVSLS